MAKTPSTSGVFNLGALGGDGASTTRPTRRWGGMTGRSLVESGNVPTTGVLSLPELLQASYVVVAQSLAFEASFTNLVDGDSASVNISSNVASGDLLLCMEHADNTNSSSAVPGSVPTGFTNVGASQANAVWQRLSYRIAGGNETTVTAGLTGGNNSSVHVLVFRPSSGSVSAVTPSTFNTENNANNFPTSPQSVSASSSTGDATIVFAAAGNKESDVDFTAGSNLDAQYETKDTSISGWRSISGYALYNGAAANHSIDWSYASSSRPTAISGYLEITLS